MLEVFSSNNYYASRQRRSPEQQSGPTADSIQAFAQLAVLYPEKFASINQGLGLITQQQKDQAADFAFNLTSTPFGQRERLIADRVRTLRAEGRNASDTASLSGQSEQDQNQALNAVQVAALSPEKRLELQSNLIASGLQPGTEEFSNAVLASITKPATQVTIGGAGKEQEEVAKLRAQALSSIREKGDAAETELANIISQEVLA